MSFKQHGPKMWPKDINKIGPVYDQHLQCFKNCQNIMAEAALNRGPKL